MHSVLFTRANYCPCILENVNLTVGTVFILSKDEAIKSGPRRLYGS